MTAVNPMHPNAPPTRDQRGYEPSMEEILASIRRIIADDQSLPGRAAPETPIVVAPAPPPRAPAPPDVQVLHPADDPISCVASPSQAAGAHSIAPVDAPMTPATATKPEAAVEPSSFAAHGTIAPQFATPQGPVMPHDAPKATRSPQGPAPVADLSETDTVPEAGDDTSLTLSAGQALEKSGEYDKPLGRHEPIPFEPTSLISPSTDQALVEAFNMLAASRMIENTDELLAMTREMIRPLLKTWLDDNLPSMVERLVRAEIERAARGGR